MLLAGDIGGTKTLLALYASGSDADRPVVEAEFHSADYASLDIMVGEFLALAPRPVTHACFGAAGPVLGGRVHFTNLPWVLEEDALCESLGLRRVTLLNDLQAIAYAVPYLRAADLHNINAGTRQAHAPIAVVAPGTGLGEAFLIWSGDRYIACPSEGGHASFAPINETQVVLWRYLAARFGHVSVERVCSGPGIANIYDCLRDAEPERETPAFAAELAQVADRTPLIAQAALQDPSGNGLAAEAVDLFVDILASEAGNMALKVLATGGVTLAGGIPVHILPKLTDGRFLQGFTGKGRFAQLLSRVPVDVVTTRAALLGAALHGLDHMRQDHIRAG
jgi:glucokinase